jgi:HAD superfamily hydrolase (TIGR01490 family)
MTQQLQPFAVFDIDGTLIRWQLYHAVVNKLAKKNLLGDEAYQQIADARMVWKTRAHSDAFKDYERQVVQLFDEAVTSLSVHDFASATKEVVEEYKDQVYTYTRDLIHNLKNQGYILLAISGSQHELVKTLAEHYGFDDAIGSVYAQKAGKFTGEKTVASEDKGQLLDELVAKYNLTYDGSYAVGDSASDAAMLAKVENPLAFNPDQNLYQLAKQHDWKIVIERKNVIYELAPDHGTYILA